MVFIIVMVLSFAACSKYSKFVGQWVEEDGNGPYNSFILHEDSSASVDDGMAGEWRINDGKF